MLLTARKMSEGKPDASSLINAAQQEASETCCPNCESPAHGIYCASCGQRLSSLHIPVRVFVADALRRMFGLDSRTLQTLYLLVCRPGLLTQHYLEGKRARYIAPLRLYLFISFVTFLLLAVTPDPERTTLQIGGADSTFTEADVPEEGQDSVVSREGSKSEGVPEFIRPAVEDPDRMMEIFRRRLPWVYFIVMPTFAGVLQLLYRRREAFYVPHLIFTLHAYTAAFLMYAFGRGLDALLGLDWLARIAIVGMICHLFWSLRRVYREGRLRTVLKQCCLLVVHGLFALIGVIIVLLYAVMTM